MIDGQAFKLLKFILIFVQVLTRLNVIILSAHLPISGSAHVRNSVIYTSVVPEPRAAKIFGQNLRKLRYQSVSSCMRNSEVTREKILSVSAALFNVQGFKATSLSDITEATGLTKGAIYRHFEDKEELEESTFDFMSQHVQEQLIRVIRSQPDAPAKLRAICEFFVSYVQNPVITGGCPVLNAGVEADDTRPGLNKKVSRLLDAMQDSLETIVRKGIKYGQIRESTDPESFATVFIAALEGAVLMSKIRKTQRDIRLVVSHLQLQIDQIKT
jgi:TetR/AcrR family transcriptional regulator, transcriptional repressor for nem operon